MPARLQIAMKLALTLWVAGVSLSLARADTGGSDEIEVVTDVAEAPAAKAPGQATTTLNLLGRMHPMLVHFPIGWLLLLMLIDLAAFWFKREDFATMGLYLLIGTMLSFFPAIIAGFLRMDELTGDVNVPAVMKLHRNLILATAVLTAAALALRLSKRNRLCGFWKVGYFGLTTAATLLMSVAGHLGGKLVFGENYLPF